MSSFYEGTVFAGTDFAGVTYTSYTRGLLEFLSDKQKRAIKLKDND